MSFSPKDLIDFDQKSLACALLSRRNGVLNPMEAYRT
jgi:hypothetical protein